MNHETARPKGQLVGITTRVFASLYDLIVLFAILFLLFAILVTGVEEMTTVSLSEMVKTILFVAIAYAYFVGFWHLGDGATTGMRPWKLQVANIHTGMKPTLLAASIRFIVYGATLIAMGATLLYLKTNDTQHIYFLFSSILPVISMLCMLLTAKKQTLHDVLAGTSVFRVFKPST